MPRCQACKQNEREWMYQPFGPGEEASFTAPGHHYRGFPAIGVCDECKQKIERGEEVTFTHKRKKYVANKRRLNWLDSFKFVRIAGSLDEGGTHILIGDDPDWDVMMCGTTIRDDEQQVVGGLGLTVGDICLDCVKAFVDVQGFDAEDRKTHRAYPA